MLRTIFEAHSCASPAVAATRPCPIPTGFLLRTLRFKRLRDDDHSYGFAATGSADAAGAGVGGGGAAGLGGDTTGFIFKLMCSVASF